MSNEAHNISNHKESALIDAKSENFSLAANPRALFIKAL
jgi:hypothetical protein